MTGIISRKTGRMLVAFIAFALVSSQARAANIDASLDDRMIAPGEATSLKVKVSDASDIKPIRVPSVQGLEITYSGMSRSIEIVNWKKSMSTVFTFQVTGFKPGSYTIPPLVFDIDGKKASTRQVSLTVSKGAPVRRRRSTSDDEGEAPASIRTLAELSGRTAYCGEPLVLRYYILSGGGHFKVDGVEKIPEAKGFVVKEQDDQESDSVVTLDGVEYSKQHLVTYVLIPTVAGRHTVEGGSCIISMQDINSFFSFPRQRRLIFESKDIDVLNIPVAGAPAGFSGLVGEFSIAADCSKDTVPVYGEKPVTVTVSGRGNLLTMAKPELSGGSGKIRTISEDGECTLKLSARGLEGEKKFIFTAIPEEKGDLALGSFSVVFYNPRTRSFETARTGEITLSATGEGRAAQRMDFENVSKGPDFNPLLIGGIVALIALVIVLVILWERRRYSIVKSGDAEADVKEEPVQPAGIEYRKEMFAALQGDDREKFLRAAERALVHLEKEADPKNTEALKRCRERIYSAKFGGGSLSREDMDEIYKTVARIIG